MEQSLIAPCGMNCGLCLAYLREKNRCPGCRGEDALKPAHCVKCSIRHCHQIQADGPGFCFACAKFPCRRLRQLDERYRMKYGMSMLSNLQQLKDEGMTSFLSGQAEKWTCSTCGGSICVHRGGCLKCKA